MKATELRIGNYVTTINGSIIPVNGINSDPTHGFITISTNERITRYFLSEIKPIPLTEEILLKCGFKNYENECSWIKQGIKIFEDENGHYIFFYHDIHLNSLHQLQNLYFALTCQELEINL